MENIARIERFTAGLNLQTFSDNEQTLFAVQHALLIISEAAAKLGRLAADICPGLPWADLRGLGNRLRHEYHTIDVARLWLMIERDLAPLKKGVEEALQELRKNQGAQQ